MARRLVLGTLAPLICLVGGLVAWRVLAAGITTMGRQVIADLPTTTTVPTAPITVGWACPAPAQGWTATIAWPPGTAPPGDWETETASSATGPWQVATTGFSGSPHVAHLAAGRPTWIEAGATDSLVSTGHALTSGEVTPPAGC